MSPWRRELYLGQGRTMSDYLSRLVARTFGAARVVQPRVPARFEPPTSFEGVQPLDSPDDGVPNRFRRPHAMKIGTKGRGRATAEASRAIEPEAFEPSTCVCLRPSSSGSYRRCDRVRRGTARKTSRRD